MELQAEPWGHVGYISPSLVCRAVWCGGGLHKEAGVIASALISCQDTHLLWIYIYTQ